MRTLLIGGFVLIAGVATKTVAQEESCVGALESRISATERLVAVVPRLDAPCRELKTQLDAFVAAEATLKKTYRAVKRACPSGEFVRGDWDDSVRSQLILETARRRLAQCAEQERN